MTKGLQELPESESSSFEGSDDTAYEEYLKFKILIEENALLDRGILISPDESDKSKFLIPRDEEALRPESLSSLSREDRVELMPAEKEYFSPTYKPRHLTSQRETLPLNDYFKEIIEKRYYKNLPSEEAIQAVSKNQQTIRRIMQTTLMLFQKKMIKEEPSPSIFPRINRPKEMESISSHYNKVVTISGAPGSGKTQALFRMANQLINHYKLKKNGVPPIPIYIDYNDSRKFLDEFELSMLSGRGSISKYLNEIYGINYDNHSELEHIPFMLLIDDIDQIDEIGLELEHLLPNCMTILTQSSSSTLKPHDNLRFHHRIMGTKFTILPLAQDQIDTFLRDIATSPEEIAQNRQILSQHQLLTKHTTTVAGLSAIKDFLFIYRQVIAPKLLEASNFLDAITETHFNAVYLGLKSTLLEMLLPFISKTTKLCENLMKVVLKSRHEKSIGQYSTASSNALTLLAALDYKLIDQDLGGIKAPYSMLKNADLSNTNLCDAGLHGANLEGSYCIGTNFSGADLRDIKITAPYKYRTHTELDHIALSNDKKSIAFSYSTVAEHGGTYTIYADDAPNQLDIVLNGDSFSYEPYVLNKKAQKQLGGRATISFLFPIVIVELATGKVTKHVEGHGRVSSLTFSQDDQYLFSTNSGPGSVEIRKWNLTDEDWIFQRFNLGVGDSPSNTHALPDNKHVILGYQGKFYTINYMTNTLLRCVNFNPDSSINLLAFTTEKADMLVTSMNKLFSREPIYKEIKIWNGIDCISLSHKTIQQVEDPKELYISPNKNLLFALSYENLVLYDLRALKSIRTIEFGSISSYAISPNNQLIALQTSKDKTYKLVIMSTSTGEIQQTFDTINCLKIIWASDNLITFIQSRPLKLYQIDLNCGEIRATWSTKGPVSTDFTQATLEGAKISRNFHTLLNNHKYNPHEFCVNGTPKEPSAPQTTSTPIEEDPYTHTHEEHSDGPFTLQ